MDLPRFVWTGDLARDAGRSLLAELRRVLDGLTGPGGVLAGHLRPQEHFRGRVIALTLTAPTTSAVLALPTGFPAPLDRLDLLDALEPGGIHRTGLAVDWRTRGARELEILSVTGLSPGVATRLRFFAWGA